MKVQKTIVFVVNTLTHGGAEIQVLRLALGMKRRGWGVCVVSLLPPEALVDQFEAAGIAVDCLNMRRGVPNPLAIFRLRAILARRQPSIVHSHISHANILTRVTRALMRVPVLVCTAHSIHEGGRLMDLAYRCTDRLADLTTNVSQAGVNRSVARGTVSAERIRFVPNGLDLARFEPDAQARHRIRAELNIADDFFWLAAGRLEEAKDYPNLLRAFARVIAARPDAQLCIAGQGCLERDIRQFIESLKLTERVRLLGVRRDIPAVMNAADGYVMSSAWEGMPLVLQEASAVRLPIVATDVGGNREVITHGLSGFLVPSKDDAALAAVMLQVMSLPPKERAAMGAAARAATVSQFGLDRVLDLWEQTYGELGASAGRRAKSCA